MLVSYLICSFTTGIPQFQRRFTVTMPLTISRILFNLSLLLFLTLFIGYSYAIDVPTLDDDVANFDEESAPITVIHEMAKRRFLPTRRELFENLDYGQGQDELHTNMKRYFLKSKRYILKSKRSID